MPAFTLCIVLLIWRKDSCCRGLRSQIAVFFIQTKTSWQLPVSPSSEPRHKRNLFTLQRKYYLPELLTVLHKSLEQFQRNFCVEHSDSESLTPHWRLDYSNIMGKDADLFLMKRWQHSEPL
ncbi:hypothetical protein CHARACLAT_027580 [Characodon lateralis]|uniref:Uncharacterized protein n=1 Tax=Characodon lateralis TaxID=208331 RepID=A0ABU7EZT5_9TELE|nr:hypothetical protein [Characodon lateralis]